MMEFLYANAWIVMHATMACFMIAVAATGYLLHVLEEEEDLDD